ncbi:MAG: hypothetical protein QW343_01425 [Candidatus Norongarragalinales archaeon]
MFLSLFFIISSFVLGLLLSFKFFKNNLLLFAIPIGFLFSTWLVFFISLVCGFNQYSISLTAVILFFVSYLILNKLSVKISLSDLLSKRVAFVFITSLFLLAIANFSMAHYDAEGNLRGIRIDFGFHSAIITSLANGNFPPENPFFVGRPLDYYYFLHLFSAALLLGGFDLLLATFLPRILLTTVIVCLFVIIVSKLFPKKSLAFAVVALPLILLNGSFEFIPWMQQNNLHFDFETINRVLIDPGFFLGGHANLDYVFPPLFPILLVQPAFLMGMICFLFVLIFFDHPEERNRGFFLGVLIGLLPMFHLFSFIVIWMFMVFYYVLDRNKLIRNSAIVSLAIAVPQLIFYLVVRNSFNAVPWLALRFGWLSPSQDVVSVALFWASNLGAYIFLGFVGYFLSSNEYVKRCFLATLPPAVLANIFIFTPFAWDNFKFFVFSFVLLAILSLYTLDYAWRRSVVGKGVSLVLFLVAIASGLLITWTFFVHTNDVIYSSDDLAACKWISANTPKNALFLTNGGHTCLFSISGRKTFLGEDLWLKSHAYNYTQELIESEQMFHHNCTILKKNRVDYLYTGGVFGRSYQLTGWSENESVYSAGLLKIYKPTC